FGLGVFLLISTLLVNFFSPDTINTGAGVVATTQSIFHLLATSTPILKGSKLLTLLGWGIIVPVIETSFWNGRLLEGLSTYAEDIIGKKVSLERMSFALWIVIFVIASLFTLFHITAKGLHSIPLLITFLFSVISSVLVIRHRQTKGAILMHCITNSAAVASVLGWF
ncbi:MAG: CPBP family glutamic-type intramembrane protease, partial [Nanoarchaeota archaeon]|nr:CPBP family glutamic-type intramembrane protease [Nanoarchaeota archaeon]